MRDLRDPETLGQALLASRRMFPEESLGRIADIYKESLMTCPDYDHGESLATTTTRQYRQELEGRAANGDRYAASLLAGNQWDEPGE